MSIYASCLRAAAFLCLPNMIFPHMFAGGGAARECHELRCPDGMECRVTGR
jgi:hypothetical protein